MTASTSPLRSRLRAATLAARRERDVPLVAALRSAVAALENAEAVPIDHLPAARAVESTALGLGAADAPRRELDDAEEDAVVALEVADLEEAARAWESAGEPARAADARRAAAVLSDLRGGPASETAPG